MKFNKNILTLTLTLLALGSYVQAERQYAQKHDENFLAATVEMPGNAVGSLFGGGYANRERIDKKEKTSMKNRKKSDNSEPQGRRARRRQRSENAE